MFRFTIRDMLWLTVVVAMIVVVWNNQRTTRAERASVKELQRELDARRSSMDKEWRFLEGTARQNEMRESDLRLQRRQFLTDQVTESERQRIMQRSAELGAPQPKPLPPGYGESPNKE